MDYTIQSHRNRHNVAYQTARTDLLDLAERGLFATRQVGKTLVFQPKPDLERRLQRLK